MKMRTLRTFAGLSYQIFKANLTKKRQPIFLSLFVTNRCNLRCKYCFVVNEEIDKEILMAEYTKEEVFRIVDEFYSMGTRMIYMLGGEPLIHKDIGEIIDYIVKKNIYLHVVTNGTLLEQKLKDIRNVHVICVSLDGIEEVNDKLRGEGVFEKVIRGVKAAVNTGIPCRIHSVLTRFNLKEVRPLAKLCKELNISLTISPPNFLGQTDNPCLRIINEEYKDFWGKYLAMQKEGLPIANCDKAIKKCIDWPVDYHRYIKLDEKHNNYDPIFCLNGYTYVALGAEGTMYNCINLGCLNGPNIKQLGIKRAWERLLEWRPNCRSCASINCIETALMLKLRPSSILKGIDLHIKAKELSRN